MSESLHNPDTKHENLATPKNKTLPNFKPQKLGEACLPTYLTSGMCLQVLWPSRVYISTLVGLIFDFRGPPASQSVINQFSVYLLNIQSLHYLAEIALHVQGSLKKQFWTLSGSLKGSGSLESWDHLRCRTGLFFLAKLLWSVVTCTKFC